MMCQTRNATKTVGSLPVKPRRFVHPRRPINQAATSISIPILDPQSSSVMMAFDEARRIHLTDSPPNIVWAPRLKEPAREELFIAANLVMSQPSESGHNLFAYPAQSNFSSVKHPLEWIEKAHAHGWDVLLDAAAFVPSNPLDLGKYRADFVPLSFYKIFGYPTGIGALLARRETLKKLHRPWFAGGTITVNSAATDASGVARDIGPALREHGLAEMANTGPD